MTEFGGDRHPDRPYAGVSGAGRVAARRERVLAAALELYGTKGYAATGVKDLCVEAGLTDRYLYESFRNREALFIATFDRLAAELFQAVVAALAAAEPDPESQLKAAVEAFVQPLADDPRKPRVLFVEAAAIGGEAEMHARSSLRGFSSLVAATAQHHLPAEASEDVLQMAVLSLVGAISEVIVEWHLGGLDVTYDQIIEQAVLLFFAAASLYGATLSLPPFASGTGSSGVTSTS